MNKPLCFLSASLLSLSFISPAWSDIESLSQEELTDTYIKDTTVLVKNQQAKPEPVASTTVNLKVSPIEQEAQVLPQDPIHKGQPFSNELLSYDYLNQNTALANGEIPQIEFALPLQDPNAIRRDETLRAKYNLSPNEPIDYASLVGRETAFNVTGAATNNSAGGLGSFDGSSITITIPNLNGANTQNHSSPNGEISVDVTPSQISYTLNLQP